MKLWETFLLAVNIPAMVHKIQQYTYRTLVLFMAFFSFTGYSYFARRENMPISHSVLQVTLTMFPVILIFSIIIFPFIECTFVSNHFLVHFFSLLSPEYN